MVTYTSVWGHLSNPPSGNLAAYILNSPHVNDPSRQEVPMYIDGITGESYTVAEYFKLVRKLAYSLRSEFGLSKGDVVCLFAFNDIFTAAIHLATLCTGARISPANIMYNPEELGHQFELTKPKLTICSDQVLHTTIRASQAHATRILPLDKLKGLIRELNSNFNAPQLEPVEIADAENEHAIYCLSSGTSGLPKGVVTTHSNMGSNVAQSIQTKLNWLEKDLTAGAVIPLSHILGLTGLVYTSCYLTRTTVVLPKFDISLLMDAVDQYKINILYLVPPIILTLGKLGKLLETKYPGFPQNIRYITSAAAPLSKSTIELLAAHCPNTTFVQQYGLTETSPFTHFGGRPGYDVETAGWLLPGLEARLVDPDTGEDIAESDGRGELWVRGPNVFLGYLDNPEATERTFAQGRWFKTGDVCIVDGKGQFKIVDRIKELIKSKGHQVAPAELEAILLTHEKVKDVAVIGVPDIHKSTELPRAFLVIESGTNVLEVLRWFNNRVARHKKLWGGAVVLEVVPKSPSGKILRRLLRDEPQHENAVGIDLAKL